ncbi:MAG TPA: hypothetical protein VFE14_13175 [Micromonosporaceae bacterium]|nr:hypothetical protein [Micromonosporaceae bacterium]
MAGPEPRAGRPASVGLAAVIMMMIAALGVISAIVTLATISRTTDRFQQLARERTDASSTEIDSVVTAIRVISVTTAIFLVLLALVLIALAIGDLRGSNIARILTWVICGLGLLCGCCGIFSALGSTRTTSLGTGDTDAETARELGHALSDAYPGWWMATSGGLSGLQLLGYIAVAVLLALPAANAFFRKPAPPVPQQPQWQPPPAM